MNEETKELIHPLNGKAKKEEQVVNKALKLPLGEDFDNDLTELLAAEGAEFGDTIVIALSDVDHFYHINDDFGLDAGDKVLIETGEYFKKNLPDYCKIYRIGGDEFGFIFKGDFEKEDIFLLLEDIRKRYEVKTPDGVMQTISIGMATAFDDANRCQELFRKADSALYRAKSGGRNKVALAKEEKMVPKTSHYTQEQLKRLTKLSKREGIGEAILLREAIDMLFKKYDI